MQSSADIRIVFTKELIINTTPSKVWKVLVNPECMVQWMSPENPIEVITGWKSGSPFIIRGKHYNMPFENKGVILAYEESVLLSYSHLSSISRLKDMPEHYAIFEFRLAPVGNQTVLTFSARNFATETIYKHLAFYWNVTLEVLKRFAERKIESGENA